MAETIKDTRRLAEKESRNESLGVSMASNTNRRKTTITEDILDKNKAEKNHVVESEDGEESESEDEGIEDFYIASRKVTNQVEEERDSLKNELRMMRAKRDSLEEELMTEKREKELMRRILTITKKERDCLKEEIRAIKLEEVDKTEADKSNKPVVESGVSSCRKSSVSKLTSTEDKVEDKCPEAKTDTEHPKIACNQIVEGDEKKTRRQSTVTFSAVKKTRNCKFGDFCQGCPTPECEICIFCLDRPSRGGKNRLKQKCLERKCRSDSVLESVPEEQEVGTESVELSCDECSQDFRRNEQLKRHMITTHGA